MRLLVERWIAVPLCRSLGCRASFLWCCLALASGCVWAGEAEMEEETVRQKVSALYIPLADHYAALVAYERYREEMVHAEFEIAQMKNWDFLRAHFQEGGHEMAFVMSPLAMDMFRQQPDFRWIGLMHRDGNALAINDLLNEQVQLPVNRAERLPDSAVAEALIRFREDRLKPAEIGMPHLLATHTVVLYQYLKDHGATLSLTPHMHCDALAIAVPPPRSPAFLKSESNRARPAAFEQSLPWAELVETEGYGHVAWYSKDVLRWPKGHVECIALATDVAIEGKFEAVREVMHYIHRAGRDIELARIEGGVALEKIVEIVNGHIPAHTPEAIQASLDHELRVINYGDLNVDKEGLRLIMDLAVEGGILSEPVDIDAFADERFVWEPEEASGKSDGDDG